MCRWLFRLVMLACMAVLALVAYAFSPLPVSGEGAAFTIKQGSSLRTVANQLSEAGVLRLPLAFEVLGRVMGKDTTLQAGNYQVAAGTLVSTLLERITSGERTLDRITLLEGWTFAQLRAALDRHPALAHDSRGLTETELIARFGLTAPSLEGAFLPDTYFFAGGASDFDVLKRAQRALDAQLAVLWTGRAVNLPYESPYEGLILASIVEKETGVDADRAMIAGVFVNRLRAGMRLQSDPTVIYGLGTRFDGNLRKPDLLADTPHNSYTRDGLPPTPIGLAGLASLNAAFRPAVTDALYFVARGDGTSQFSRTLADHNRAVTKYQKRQGRP
ncbi:MAG: endolytic transglycosylase MltG [Burkholderiales bacterium]